MARRRPARIWWRRAATLLALLGIVGLAYSAYLDAILRAQFNAKRWSLPARVYARPLEMYPGRRLAEPGLLEVLRGLRYQRVARPLRPGTYQVRGDTVELVTRDFAFWDGYAPSQAINVRFDATRIAALSHPRGGAVQLVRLDPLYIGGIYPGQYEDRILVRLTAVPTRLVKGLIAVEDRRFYHHHGLDFRAIARALLVNLRAGATVQGGSTLTQQLVKNYFLSNRRTLWRKANEAVMAVLLELHYSKRAILQAYLNEVYLGQEGKRAIHGVGLASHFYFDRSVTELTLPQIALLIGLVRGPSYYDPRRYPHRALQRRNQVLAIMARQGVISAAEAASAQRTALGVSKEAGHGATPYPAFMDLVKRQLRRDYRKQDLSTEGLHIFTTLDPLVQRAVAQAMVRRVAHLERARGLPRGSLEGAAIVTRASSGEVLAMVGGRRPGYAGFNRALDIRRPIGSLIKPAIYLTALAQPTQYTPLSPLNDGPLRLTESNGRVWMPKNYSGKSHGIVPLYVALTHSYNLATVRLGLALGVPRVIDTLHRLGIEETFKPYPALLLGATALSPYDVAQMYQTLAGDGFRTPLRAIREVVSRTGKPLQHYPLKVEQAANPAAVEVLDSILRNVVREGTAKGLSRWIAPAIGVAGKTGTTNDLRDSWFAGYTNHYVAVVWLGTDDDRSTGLTGSSGALSVWGDFMRHLPLTSLRLPVVEHVETLWVDPATRLLANAACPGAVPLAFIAGSAPTRYAPCADGGAEVMQRMTH